MASGTVIEYKGRRGVTWRVKYLDTDGRQIQETLGRQRDGWNRQRAERELGKRLDRVERERWRKPGPATFKDHAQTYMAEHLPGLHRKTTTVRGYRQILDTHLLPAFGHIPLADLETRPELIDSYIAQKTHEGLSPKTVTNHLALLRVMIERAIKWRRMRTNPVDAVDRPTLQQPEMTVLTETEIARLTTAYDQLLNTPDEADRRWFALAKTVTLTVLGTALRRGEVLGLRWKDIELLEGRLHVRQAYVRGQMTTPKSRASRRTIAIGPRTTGLLANWWQRTPFQGDDEHVFPNPNTGAPADPTKLSRYMRQALNHAGIHPGFRVFHDLRHTALTHEAAAGNPHIYLQHRAGHSQASITERYLHAAQTSFPGAAEKGENRIFSKTPTD